MANVMCHICNGLVDRIGLQPLGVSLCSCAKMLSAQKATIIAQQERIAELESTMRAIMNMGFESCREEHRIARAALFSLPGLPPTPGEAE